MTAEAKIKAMAVASWVVPIAVLAATPPIGILLYKWDSATRLTVGLILLATHVLLPMAGLTLALVAKRCARLMDNERTWKHAAWGEAANYVLLFCVVIFMVVALFKHRF